ncbi:oligopeptide ABC transporter permease [Clostridium omnivorum]|uniref:Peptide ABC transporter permease n=1 Tax=Clostridium omnivorum TaxID=1604902 RepID=A0ABQ5N293_9CLOT|nr:oligopeptide ABC transporter permease [Clostridium sp. E14]GLC29299.1 peptide ABC transporter permease [Clostridium sp. E14]
MEADVNVNEIKKEDIISPWKIAWKRLKKNKLALTGLFILIFMVLMSIVGPWISPYDMETIDLGNVSSSPTAQHLLGTDSVGRDVLTRIMYAGRISLSVGVVAVVIEIVIGSILGAVAGYYGGVVDGIIMRIVDVFMCFPSLPILIMLGALMSDLKVRPEYRMFVVMFILGVLSWPGLCRIVRGQILSLREQEFMQAAEALGLKDRKKMFRHLLPNTFASIIVTATLGIGGAILTESALSFLGLGVTPPTPSWGNMVQVVNDLYILQTQPWLWIPPGLCIFLTVISINIFGDGLRDALDPKLKV